MKSLRNVLSVFLCLIMLLGTVSIAASASSGVPEDNLELIINTDKENYGAFDKAKITVTVINIGDDSLCDVSAGVSGSTYRPLKGETTYCRVDRLEPGESVSVTFRAVIPPDTKGLSFFTSLFLKIKAFFLKTQPIPLTGIRDIYTVNASKTVNHGGAQAVIAAYALFGGKYSPVEETEEPINIPV